MLELTCERAGVEDGMTILDLGCGWGALSLWLAERLPRARVLAVSNSKLQRDWIAERARQRGAHRLEVRTADVNHFAPVERFDRIVSVEMLEHVRAWPRLFERMAGWLGPGGEVFLHVFCHRSAAYPFETDGRADWMGRHFFTGGMMPSFDLASRAGVALDVVERWVVEGTHYQRTAEAWLRNLDGQAPELRAVLAGVRGVADAGLALARWRLFFLSVAELFGFDGGREWGVGHYRLRSGRHAP
jgi:cyclopropane-fatty-acyl-phospholipid synthase